MVDTHYDLLSIAYTAYLKNDYSYLEKISHYFNENNVVGVIANLYFMSKEEMRAELHPKYYQEDVSVLEMFKSAKKVLDTYLPDVDILYSVEGPDFIKDENELEELYYAGLNSLIIAWNTESKYASGNRSDKGVTDAGRKLFKKAMELHMGIDLSHANKKSFYDTVDLIREEQAKGVDVCCYASHSNSRSLCDRDRNLDDNQLKAIASISGLVGVFSNSHFVVSDYTLPQEKLESSYLEHIKHVASIVGLDNVMVATDDMDFCKDADPEYGEVQIYDYSSVGPSIYRTLSKGYDDDTIRKIMHDNVKEKVFSRIRNYNKGKGAK